MSRAVWLYCYRDCVRCKMLDLLMVVATIGFFLVAIAYTVACDRLK